MTVKQHNNVPTLAKFGSYSPLAEASTPGRLVTVSGQFGTDNRGEFPNGESAEAQIRGIFKNLEHALEAAGLDFSNVMKFTTFLVGRETVDVFMKVRNEIFADIYPDGVYPGNTLLLVDGLVQERFVAEIEAIAFTAKEN